MTAERPTAAKPRRGAVVVVDDHKIIRETLRMMLAETTTPVVAVADTASAGFECVVQHRPDVVILDVRLPDENGFITARRIRERSPTTKIVMLSGFSTSQSITAALLARVNGFVTKQEPVLECVRAIQSVMSGTIHLSPEAVRILSRGPQPEGA